MLQISDDANLAITRLLLLHNYGFDAEHFFKSQVQQTEALGPFKIFLICQSIGHDDAADLSARIRSQFPDARILRVRSHANEPDHIADLTLAPPAGPWELMRGVETLAANLRAPNPERER